MHSFDDSICNNSIKYFAIDLKSPNFCIKLTVADGMSSISCHTEFNF